MVDIPEATPPQPEAAPSPRRRFLKRGLAGGSVLLAASTHRAFAGGSCGLYSYSGHTSALKSAKKKSTGGSASQAKFCPGLSPGYWAPPGKTTRNLSAWSTTGFIPTGSNATTFESVFTTPPGYGFSNNATLFKVVSTVPDTPARQFVAAVLDAASDPNAGTADHFPYTVADVVNLWLTGDKTALAAYFSGYLFA
jgi:hypothetical protein